MTPGQQGLLTDGPCRPLREENPSGSFPHDDGQQDSQSELARGVGGHSKRERAGQTESLGGANSGRKIIFSRDTVGRDFY